MLLINRKKGRASEAAARALYEAVVAQSRQPAFYASLGVPDTLDGRFDMVVLHVFLLLHRFHREGRAAKQLAQNLFDTLFEDMDYNLRELGVGDLGVGRRIKVMAKALYGRIAAYEAGLAADDVALASALERNLFRNSQVAPGQLSVLCGYLRREAAALGGVPLETFAAGRVGFGPVPACPAETPSGRAPGPVVA
jgi:cytochrome b pre-mRNA-processing protein 3